MILNRIYFDNNATTKPTKEVIQDITWCLENAWGNPSSVHSIGYFAKQLLIQSRNKVAKYINANPEEIIFTSSGSQANNLAIKGFLTDSFTYDCIITTKAEHPSVFNTCLYLHNRIYDRLEYAPLDEYGAVDIEKFETLISELSIHHYCFVSIMLANNEIGTINDIKAIAQIVHRYQGILHVDAIAAISHIPVDVKELECDLLTFSGHKLNCPKGVGVLYKKNGITLSPIIHGGHQENGLVAGTENVPYIYALGNQTERLINKEYLHGVLRDYLYEKIHSLCHQLGINVQINGSLINRLPNNLSLTFSGINAEILITLLDMHNVQVSAGSACSSGEKTPSRVLKAIGLSDEDAFSTIRISISDDTTVEECDEFIEQLGSYLEALKKIV